MDGLLFSKVVKAPGMGRRGMNWESRTDMYTTTCKIDSSGKPALKHRAPSSVLGDDL